MSHETPAYLPPPAPQEPGAPINSFVPQMASMPDRWHREAADIVLEVMASTEPHTQFDGLVKAVAHLISEHAEDLVALVNQIRLSQTEIDALRARLATEQRAAAEREKLAAYEELRGLRQKWLAAAAQAQRFALRLGMWQDREAAPPLPPGEEATPGKEVGRG